MKRFFTNNGLSLVMFGAFFVLLVGHSIAGYFHYNEEQLEHNQPTISYGEYLRSGSFLESVGEKLGERIPANGCLCRPHGLSVSKGVG